MTSQKNSPSILFKATKAYRLVDGTDSSMVRQFNSNCTQQPRVVRRPNVDRPWALFAALLYFCRKEDGSLGSNLETREAKKELHPQPHEVSISVSTAEIDHAVVRKVKGSYDAANTLVLLLNSARSIGFSHGAQPGRLARINLVDA